MNLNVGAHNITYSLLIISCSVQLFYLVFFYLRLIIYKQIKQEKTHVTAVSIIICAKNEAHNLNKNLSFILNQKYSKFEVIVVNHDSTDDSEEILSEFEKKHNHLKALSFKNNKSGKKEPISYAIEHASYEHLIFTDADCKPNSDLWINKFSNGFKEKEIIIDIPNLNYNDNTKKFFVKKNDKKMSTLKHLAPKSKRKKLRKKKTEKQKSRNKKNK